MSRLSSSFIKSFVPLCFLLFFYQCIYASPGSINFRSRAIGSQEGLPSDNVEQVFQDSEGYMWFATRNGLARYDGFGMEVYKSNVRNGDILTNNNITCLAEDSSNRLWIGTPDGINVFDKPTATLRRFDCEEFRNNPISCILTTRSGRVLVGSDQGLYEFWADADSCTLFTRERSGDVMPQTSVKSLMEDSRGNIWIGTWNENFYRIDPDGHFYAYHGLNDRKSAHVIFEDSRHRIWVGTWGRVLYLLRNPYEPEKTTWVKYVHDPADQTSISDNIIYSLAEDPSTRTLWVGTRKGVSMLREGTNSFTHIYSVSHDSPVREVTSIISDRIGMMWVSMLGHGVLAMMKQQSGLFLDRLESVKTRFGTNEVKRIMSARDGRLWLGLGGNLGLVIYNPADGSVSVDDINPFSA